MLTSICRKSGKSGSAETKPVSADQEPLGRSDVRMFFIHMEASTCGFQIVIVTEKAVIIIDIP